MLPIIRMAKSKPMAAKNPASRMLSDMYLSSLSNPKGIGRVKYNATLLNTTVQQIEQ